MRAMSYVNAAGGSKPSTPSPVLVDRPVYRLNSIVLVILDLIRILCKLQILCCVYVDAPKIFVLFPLLGT
jgi:hypothetical protein